MLKDNAYNNVAITPTGEIVRSGPKMKRGCPVACLYCDEGEVSMYVGDLGRDDAFTCRSCNKSWSLETVRQVIQEWLTLISWLDTAPTYVPEE